MLEVVTRLFVNKLLNNLSFIKTYPSGSASLEKLSLKTYIYTPKRFHWIHCKKGIGLTPINLSNTYPASLRRGIRKRYIRAMSSSTSCEPVLIYTTPDEHKITKQNKGKSGVYRWGASPIKVKVI